jgi:FkbM family methyltransferase
MRRVARAARALARELRGALRITAGTRSALRLCGDLVALRLARLTRREPSDAPRAIVLADGRPLRYRLNRGDLQSLREVWMDEVYRPPMDIHPDVVVDLGANIGLTTRWLHHRLGARSLLTVEASEANNRLLEHNVPAGTRIVRAAVGPRDGVGLFAPDTASNLGRLADGGRPVPQVSMDTVLGLLPEGRRVDLLKLDIEGGEQELLTGGDLGWLDRVDAIIAEFHPLVVDYPGLVGRLVAHGFDHVPAGSAWAGSMDAFVRRS